MNNFSALLDFSSTAACHLPKDFGSCSSNHSLRFYYESDSKQCRKFWFSGCGGNQVCERHPQKLFREINLNKGEKSFRIISYLRWIVSDLVGDLLKSILYQVIFMDGQN